MKAHEFHFRLGLFNATVRGLGAKFTCLPSAALLISVLGIGCCPAISLAAQPPGKPPAQAPPDLTAMLDRFFGMDSQQEEKALAAIKISPKEEEELGRTATRAYLDFLKEQKIRVVARGKEVDYLRRLVETIRPSMAEADRYRRITVYLAESRYCEARSLPGGTLVFFRGLLESAETEAALVGVIGHELSHLDHKHTLVHLRRMKLMQQSFSAGAEGFSPDRLFTASGIMARLWSRPFRPEDERTADLDGARWAYQAGYDPREMVRVIAKIGEREKKQRIATPPMFGSHPPSAERSKAVLDLYAELQKAKPKDHLYIGRENLRRRVTRAGAELPP
jgi:predicted Zn-dependent protease